MKTIRATRATQRGVSILGVNIAVAMTAAALVAALPLQIDKIQSVKAELSAHQLFTIQDIATQYRAELGVWPGAASVPSCEINAVMTDLVTQGLLVAPLTTSAWGSAITSSCDTEHFDVTTTAPNNQRAQEAGNNLPAATIAGNSVTTRGALGSFAGNSRVLHRVVVPGHPELNTMEASIDMGTNDITNAGAIAAKTLTVDGDSTLCAAGTVGCKTAVSGAKGAFVTTANANVEFQVAGAGGQLMLTNPTAGNGKGSLNAGFVDSAAGLRWANNSELVASEGGSIELGGGGTDATNPAAIGNPYIDFHFNGSAEDYNVRLQNSDPHTLNISAPGASTANLSVTGDAAVGNNMGARDFISSVTHKGESQSVHTITIVAPDTVVPIPSYCADLGMVPKIYTSAAAFAEGNTATPVYQVRTYAIANGGSWTVKMILLTENGVQMSPDPNYNSILVAIKCELT